MIGDEEIRFKGTIIGRVKVGERQTTPEAVAQILARDERLTDEQCTALAELFAAAYEKLATGYRLPATIDK